MAKKLRPSLQDDQAPREPDIEERSIILTKEQWAFLDKQEGGAEEALEKILNREIWLEKAKEIFS